MILRRVATTDESDIYRDLMRFRPAELSQNAWAVKAGVSRTVWADMRRHGNPSRRTLEKLLTAADSSLAEFEALRLGPEPRMTEAPSGLGDPSRSWNPASPPTLPLVLSLFGGEWGEAGGGIELTQVRSDELLDHLPRPPSLASDPNAFAVTNVGQSMWPRFRPGSRLAVSPRAPVAIGDDVLVRMSRDAGGSDQVLIKQLLKQDSSGIELRQFSPDRTFRVSRDDIHSIAKVLGELI